MSNLPDRIVLIGLPGSGKSTVGPILAQQLGWKFVDFDPVIEAEAGLSIRDIFQQQGEAEFRRLESELTGRLASEPHIVLAPGGGWILRNEVPNAFMVWLKVTPDEASYRIREFANLRPLLQGNTLERIRALLEEREAYYRRAHVTIDTHGLSATEVADKIVVAMKEYAKQNQ